MGLATHGAGVRFNIGVDSGAHDRDLVAAADVAGSGGNRWR
jgi:hypothetical protein